MITVGYINAAHASPCICEINYINYCVIYVIYLTFKEKFDNMKEIHPRRLTMGLACPALRGILYFVDMSHPIFSLY